MGFCITVLRNGKPFFSTVLIATQPRFRTVVREIILRFPETEGWTIEAVEYFGGQRAVNLATILDRRQD
jgi:hypothetical protein